MIKKPEKRKLHTHKYPRNTTINTVSSYALSLPVYHSSFLKTNTFMPVIPVFNNADDFMPFCRRYVSCHF